MHILHGCQGSLLSSSLSFLRMQVIVCSILLLAAILRAWLQKNLAVDGSVLKQIAHTPGLQRSVSRCEGPELTSVTVSLSTGMPCLPHLGVLTRQRPPGLRINSRSCVQTGAQFQSLPRRPSILI